MVTILPAFWMLVPGALGLIKLTELASENDHAADKDTSVTSPGAARKKADTRRELLMVCVSHLGSSPDAPIPAHSLSFERDPAASKALPVSLAGSV
jgi:hypothetical protein